MNRSTRKLGASFAVTDCVPRVEDVNSRLLKDYGETFLPRMEIPPGSVMDRPDAHRLFAEIEDGIAKGYYGYQVPFEDRSPTYGTYRHKEFLSLSSYDYLGLSQHPEVIAASANAVSRYGAGSAGVRLLTGSSILHEELEHALSDFLGTEGAVTFSSGYLANIAAMSAVAGSGDILIIDRAAHQSLFAGALMSGAEISTFRHNHIDDLERRLKRTDGKACRRSIVVEGVYSMDGDICRLDEIADLAERHGAFLIVDESHAIGNTGLEGRGTPAKFGLRTDKIALITASLAKAVPGGGGVIAGSHASAVYLQHRAAPYFFSAALSPAAAGAALKAIEIMKSDPDRHTRLQRNTERLRDGLASLGYDTGQSETAIIPVLLGSNETAYRVAGELFRLGIAVSPVIPPAVPKSKSRLRLCANSEFSERDIDKALHAFANSEVRKCLQME